jgi:hypothetical protein
MLMERMGDKLDAISRTRPLTDAEVLRLERAVRRTAERRERWHWTRADDYRLVRHLLRGRKPAMIARMMKRSEGAIWKRMMRLGLSADKIGSTVNRPGSGRRAKCPIASNGGK